MSPESFDEIDEVPANNAAVWDGAAWEPLESGMGELDIGDAVIVINFVFKGGPRPDCTPN